MDLPRMGFVPLSRAHIDVCLVPGRVSSIDDYESSVRGGRGEVAAMSSSESFLAAVPARLEVGGRRPRVGGRVGGIAAAVDCRGAC